MSSSFVRYARKKRSVWVKPGQTEEWWKNLESSEMSPEEWKNNLQLSKKGFHKLMDAIRPFAKLHSSKVRQDVLRLEKRIAITLYYLNDQGSMKMTANTFSIARCTVRAVVHKMCQILNESIGPKIVKFHVSKQEIAEATGRFLQKFGFPQVIGCIDGTHILMKQPSENFHVYFSYKICYTINCQAICDAYG